MPRFFNIPTWQLDSDIKDNDADVEYIDEESGDYMAFPCDGEAIAFSYKGKTYSGIVLGEVFESNE